MIPVIEKYFFLTEGGKQRESSFHSLMEGSLCCGAPALVWEPALLHHLFGLDMSEFTVCRDWKFYSAFFLLVFDIFCFQKITEFGVLLLFFFWGVGVFCFVLNIELCNILPKLVLIRGPSRPRGAVGQSTFRLLLPDQHVKHHVSCWGVPTPESRVLEGSVKWSNHDCIAEIEVLNLDQLMEWGKVAGCAAVVPAVCLWAWSSGECCRGLPVVSALAAGECKLFLQDCFQVPLIQEDRCPEATNTIPLIFLWPACVVPVSGWSSVVLPSRSPSCWRWLRRELQLQQAVSRSLLSAVEEASGLTRLGERNKPALGHHGWRQEGKKCWC